MLKTPLGMSNKLISDSKIFFPDISQKPFSAKCKLYGLKWAMSNVKPRQKVSNPFLYLTKFTRLFYLFNFKKREFYQGTKKFNITADFLKNYTHFLAQNIYAYIFPVIFLTLFGFSPARGESISVTHSF